MYMYQVYHPPYLIRKPFSKVTPDQEKFLCIEFSLKIQWVILFSCSKLGHSDVVMGALITNSDGIADKLRFLQNGECLFTILKHF